MDNILKEAFQKVKQDIFSLGNEIQQLRTEMLDIKTEIKLISSFISDLKTQQLSQEYQQKISQTPENQQIPIIQTQENIPTHPQENPTNQHIISTHPNYSTQNPTDNLPLYGLKSPNSDFSIGNRGVPTNKQTNKQTNQHIIQHIKTEEPTTKEQERNHLDKISEIISGLDSIKKELRIKIKRLTNQEMLVFSALYSLESQGNIVDYALLATTLKLSESSIREYILKIQKKGLPIHKEKLNNKRILLNISPELRKIASLDTILKLREL